MASLIKDFDELEGGDILQYVSTNVTTLSFPEKLMYMMMSVEKHVADEGRQQSSAAIVWNPEGTAIIIMNSEELEDFWFPRFFGSNCKFKSFTRKLYRWGFKKYRSFERSAGDLGGVNATVKGIKGYQGCFQHTDFQRDQKNLLYKMENMTCDKTQRTGARSRRRERPWNFSEYPGTFPPALRSPTTALAVCTSGRSSEPRFAPHTSNIGQSAQLLPSMFPGDTITKTTEGDHRRTTGQIDGEEQAMFSTNGREYMLAYHLLLASSSEGTAIPEAKELPQQEATVVGRVVQGHDHAVDMIPAYSATNMLSLCPINREQEINEEKGDHKQIDELKQRAKNS